MEVLRSGCPGMDAGRAAMGHGWPVAACPRSRTGTREPERSEGRTPGQGLFGYFCGCLTKVPRCKSETRKTPLRSQWICTPTQGFSRSKDREASSLLQGELPHPAIYNPPFTCSTSPVMKLDPSLHKKAMTEAISLGWPRRLSGVCSTESLPRVAIKLCVIGVSMMLSPIR